MLEKETTKVANVPAADKLYCSLLHNYVFQNRNANQKTNKIHENGTDKYKTKKKREIHEKSTHQLLQITEDKIRY